MSAGYSIDYLGHVFNRHFEGCSRRNNARVEVQAESQILSIVIYLLYLEHSWHLGLVLEHNVFGKNLSYKKGFKINFVLIDCDEGVLSNRTHFQHSHALLTVEKLEDC